MCKSAAVLLLVIAFVGKQAGQASSSIPTGGAGTDNVKEGSEMTPALAGGLEDHQPLEENTHVSVKKEQAGVEAKNEEEHTHKSSEDGKALQTKISEKPAGEDENQADSADSTSTASATDDAGAGSEGAGGKSSSATATGGSEAQQHEAINPHITNKKDQAEVKTLEEEKIPVSSEETRSLKSNIKDTTGERELGDVSMKCLDCLCYFATDCALERPCEEPDSDSGLGVGFEKGDCGPFHISFPFWADAHKVQMDIGDAQMEHDWRQCSLDLLCATETIQKYYHKYQHDCNGDGKVDCIDYAAIHTLGPFGCMERKNLNLWNIYRRKRLLECMVNEEEGAYAKKMQDIKKMQEELNKKLEVQDIGGRKLAEIEKRKSSNTIKTDIHTAAEQSEGKMMNADAETEAHLKRI